MMETESQKFQRYCQSELCGVSDPETWMSTTGHRMTKPKMMSPRIACSLEK